MKNSWNVTATPIRNLLIVSLLAVGTLAFGAGCSSDSSSASGTDSVASTTIVSSAPTQTITVLTTSAQKILHTAGASGEHVYGWNRLVGDGTSGAETVNVEMLVTVNYTNGSGSFVGVFTFTYADGSTLGFDIRNGTTVAATDTTDATFHSDLVVIAGTGKYATATGTGTFDGSRKDALGGAVQMTFALRLN
jgi:hypothetical protein